MPLMAMINRANEECHAVLITVKHPADRVKSEAERTGHVIAVRADCMD